MAAAEGEPTDPAETGLLALDVPRDSDLPQYTKTVDVLRDVVESAAAYARERDIDGPLLRYGEADGERVDLGVVPAQSARYVAEQVADAVDMHGYGDEVDVVYERMDGGGVLHPDTALPEDAIVVDISDDMAHREPPRERERFSDWSDEKAERKLEEVRERLDRLRDE